MPPLPKPAQAITCPEGISDCPVMAELTRLQAEISELRQLIRTDPLTGLSNVRHFRETLEHELERTRRSGQPTALIMVDLDHFKRINDTWGHEAGNKALIQTAAVLNLNTRKLDIPCRYGGEEFAVILPTTELLTARRVAERLRAAIEATAIPLETTTLRFTASLGLAIYTRHDRDSTEQFIACADQQLYRAKQDGRNRVCFAITPVEPEAAQVSMDEKELLSRLFSDAPDSDAPDS